MPTEKRPASITFGDQPILITYRHPPRRFHFLRWAVLIAGTFIVAYGAVVRPWQLHWGATPEEAARSLPGDGLVPGALSESTRAITITAPSEAVWPWLLQMGQDRAGTYSYDWLENLVGFDVHSANRIVPRLQHLGVGDTIRLASKKRFADASLVVAEIRPERALVLRTPRIAKRRSGYDFRYAFSWAFVLNRLDERSTRLTVRTRYEIDPSLIGTPALFLLVEPVEFGLTREMLRGIKARAELAERASDVSFAQERFQMGDFSRGAPVSRSLQSVVAGRPLQLNTRAR